MAQETWDRIRANPKFQAFVKKRNTYSIIMTALGALVYYGFILLVAYDKEFLARRIGDGVMTLGIPLGVGVIVFTIALTWIYVNRANNQFDAESEAIVKEATR
ncbi:MAG: DUF485 domain-containing protein [Pseudomonadota bacterium]|nr:DUF485 domain-containing protein [Rhodocyclaceae bacterium]